HAGHGLARAGGLDVAQRDADVGDAETLGVGGEHRPFVADAPDRPEVGHVGLVVQRAALHRRVVAVGGGGVAVDLQLAVLAADARVQGHRADVPAQLHVRRQAAVLHRRHPHAVGQRQALRGGVLDQVDAGAHAQALDAEQVAVGVAQAQALLLRDDLGLVPDAVGFRRRGLDQLAVGAVLGQVAHRLVGPVGVHAQVAAEEVGVGVLHRDLLEIVELGQRTRDLSTLGGVGARHRALDRIQAAALDLHVVVLAADVEVAVAGLDALHLAFAEVVAALDEHVLGVGIRQRAGGVHADAAAVAVIGNAAVQVGDAGEEVSGVATVGVGHAELVLVAVALELGPEAGADRGLVAILVRHAGQVVDHAAGAADALGRRRAVDHLDPADHAHVGEGAVAAALAQRRALRDAVEQAQRDAATQRLARVAHRLRGFGI